MPNRRTTPVISCSGFTCWREERELERKAMHSTTAAESRKRFANNPHIWVSASLETETST